MKPTFHEEFVLDENLKRGGHGNCKNRLIVLGNGARFKFRDRLAACPMKLVLIRNQRLYLEPLDDSYSEFQNPLDRSKNGIGNREVWNCSYLNGDGNLIVLIAAGRDTTI